MLLNPNGKTTKGALIDEICLAGRGLIPCDAGGVFMVKKVALGATTGI